MLGDALEATRAAERQRAARALLGHPLLRASGPRADSFALVRRHEAPLREWFERNTGWRLEVHPEVARLLTTPADPFDATHPLTDSRADRRSFSRRRYVLLALCLAALERADTQVTLGRLAEQVVLLAADPDLVATGLAFRLEHRDERLDLVAAVRALLELGALVRVAGAEDAFVREDGDALYDVDRRVLALLLVSRQGPSSIGATSSADRLAALAETGAASGGAALSEEARVRGLRHRLTRLLLELPVVHDDDLTDEERGYLRSQRAAITARIGELTGLVPEVRAEGIAMVDPDDQLTDVRMPEVGTNGHVTLLIAEHLAHRDRAEPGVAVSIGELHTLARRLAEEHRGHWRHDTRVPGAEEGLVEQALARLAALRLVRRVESPAAGDGSVDVGLAVDVDAVASVRARPALHRYAVTAPVMAGER